MGQGKLYKDTIGVPFRVDAGEVITGATAYTLVVKKPNGAVVTWTPTILGTRQFQYAFVAGDLDQVGVYTVQPSYTLAGVSGLKTPVQFTVWERFTGTATNLSEYALITAEDFKSFASIEDSNLYRAGVAIYSTDGTAATVSVASNTLTLAKTGGTSPALTFDLTLAAHNTLGELVDAINDAGGWMAVLLGWTDALSVDLVNVSALSCTGYDGQATLQFVDNYMVESFINYCSAWIESYCRRNFKARTYKLERYDGGGGQIFLRQYPLISVEQVSVGELYVANISYSDINVYNARVTITATGLKLDVDKTSTPELSFASYPTMTLLIDAVNALGGNWKASLFGSLYANYPSDMLIRKDSQWARLTPLMLSVPSWPLGGVQIEDYELGVLSYDGGITEGNGNVFVSYMAGYFVVPDELKSIVCQAVKYLYDIRQEDHSMASESLGDYSYSSATLEESLPAEAISQLKRLRRPLI